MLDDYIQIQTINENHKVYLVKSLQNNSYYVKKTLNIYDKNIYTFLAKNHIPGTPAIKELIENNGQLIVIEEYISGPTLETIIQNKTKLDEKQTTKIITQICNILIAITKELPLVHRDIKPSNIIIKDSGQVYLIDFNSAKLNNQNKTRDTILIGTQGYAAPEQYGFLSSSTQTDIYALGVLMKELLTGNIDLNENYNNKLKPIIQKCTMMDPTKRYSSYKQLLKQFKDQPLTPNCYLPVGYRSGNSLAKVFATFWYFIIIIVVLLGEVKGYSKLGSKIYSTGVSLSLLFVTALSGNYLNCQKLFRLDKIQNKFLKVCAICFIDVFGLVIIVSLAEWLITVL